MDVILDRVAGLDVHRDTIEVCVRVTGKGNRREQTIARFQTKTSDLLGLRDWLQQWQVTHVAMESTGEYWKAVYFLLEDDFHVLLVNAAHIKNVPGRKTDATDASWIAQLLECGLLRGSFIPPRPIRELRDLTRYRKRMVEVRTQEVVRLHGVLQRAGIKLSSVAKDIMGVSGRAILQALVEGKKDAAAMAELAKGSLRGKIPLLRKALEGQFAGHHRIMVAQMLAHVHYLEETIEELNREIDLRMEPYRPQRELLETIPGFGKRSAEVVIAEIGVDMNQFPTAGNLASWAGVCPGNHRSAGKRKPEPVRRGNRWLKPALVEATWAAVRENDSYLSAQYHRLAPHKGKKKANIAVCHSALIAAHHILREGAPYHDLGADFFVKRNQAAIERRCVNQLKKLGWEVDLRKTG
jgi:transposase